MKVGDIVIDKNGEFAKILDTSVYNSVKVEYFRYYMLFNNINIPKEWFRLATPEEIAEIIAEKLK